MITIDAISDLHGHHPELPGGDILIVAGDCTNGNGISTFDAFIYINHKKYRYIVFVGGNHDHGFEGAKEYLVKISPQQITYLEDSSCEIEGLKIWGSPRTPFFLGQNPNAMVFCDFRDQMHKYWDKIPEGLDILVTHGPPMAVLDAVNGDCVGDGALRDAILKKRPRIAIFGHCHEGGGQIEMLGDTYCYNVSCVDECYRLVRGAMRIEIDHLRNAMQNKHAQ